MSFAGLLRVELVSCMDIFNRALSVESTGNYGYEILYETERDVDDGGVFGRRQCVGAKG